MTEYVEVVDICRHEDYPCCGCSREEYVMKKIYAEDLAKEGRIKILGPFKPDVFW